MTKVVLVTGASSGLGKALCERLSQSGFRVYGTSRNPDAYQLPFPLLALDVTDPAGINRVVEQVITENGRIDVLINNAGVGMAAPLEKGAAADVEQLFRINVFGTLQVCQAVLPHMRAAGTGMILNVSSIGGSVGLPFRGAYCASKAALDMLTETLRLEVKHFGIEVGTIPAGDMRTPIKQHWIGGYRPETDHTYGDDYRLVTKAIEADNERGMSPQAVAARIEQLIRSERIGRSTVVGKPLQRLAITAKRLLPDAWFEKIILKHSKLNNS